MEECWKLSMIHKPGRKLPCWNEAVNVPTARCITFLKSYGCNVKRHASNGFLASTTCEILFLHRFPLAISITAFSHKSRSFCIYRGGWGYHAKSTRKTADRKRNTNLILKIESNYLDEALKQFLGPAHRRMFPKRRQLVFCNQQQHFFLLPSV